MKLIAAERHNKIIDALNTRKSMKIAELADLFQVSKETIRRDLLYLNKIGALRKSHGGAISINSSEFNTVSLENRIKKNQEHKFKLCMKAIEYLPEKAIIFIDTGSTTHYIAEILKSHSNYTIITNSINAANTLVYSKNKTLITGGEVNADIMGVGGFQTTSFLEKIKVDIAFLGTTGFEHHQGPAGTDFSDVQIKQTIIRNSNLNIVISESSKSTYTGLVQYANWQDIHYFVTDHQISSDTITRMNQSTQVVIADI